MSFTNINDPAGVKALLERLRSSQQWQDVAAVTAAPSSPVPPAAASTTTPAPPPSSEISALLAQLQSKPLPHPVATEPPQPPPSPARPRKQDARHLSFQQALPRLATLADIPEVRAELIALREEQAALERKLAAERDKLLALQTERVRTERTKAAITGVMPSAAALTQNFQRELDKFDEERILPAFDNLRARQQRALEGLSVPAMFETDSQSDRERQQRIMQVLEGVLAGEDGNEVQN